METIRRGACVALGLWVMGCVASHGSHSGALDALGTAECTPHVTPIYAGQTIPAGTVTVTNSATDLIVVVDGSGDWLINAVHVYAGTDPVPIGPGGNPAPGQFPYHQNFDGDPVAHTVLTIPLPELAIGCGDTLNIAVHTEMLRVVDGTVVQSETGWAYGPGGWEGSRWGWWFTYTTCCDEPEDSGCTLTQGYWKNHPSAWPVDNLTLGGVVYDQEELLALLRTPVRGDASLILGHQLIAALLNVASGADAVASVEDAIDGAHAWLIDHADSVDGRLPFGRTPGAAHSQATAIADALAAFNEGLTETPHCD